MTDNPRVFALPAGSGPTYDSNRCWADARKGDGTFVYINAFGVPRDCDSDSASDLGLCAKHHYEITGLSALPLGPPVPEPLLLTQQSVDPTSTQPFVPRTPLRWMGHPLMAFAWSMPDLASPQPESAGR